MSIILDMIGGFYVWYHIDTWSNQTVSIHASNCSHSLWPDCLFEHYKATSKTTLISSLPGIVSISVYPWLSIRLARNTKSYTFVQEPLPAESLQCIPVYRIIHHIFERKHSPIWHMESQRIFNSKNISII